MAIITGRKACPKCGGRGHVERRVIDPDTNRPEFKVFFCECVRGQEGAMPDIPERLDGFTLQDVKEWWLSTLNEREKVKFTSMGASSSWTTDSSAGMHVDLFLKAVAKLTDWTQANGADAKAIDTWWIHGPSGSGKSTLAATILREWCQFKRKSGTFVSARSLGKDLLNAFSGMYDGIYGERPVTESKIVTPLMSTPLLVIDDWDHLENDIRVATSVARVLEARYSDRLPTIMVAGAKPEVLWARQREYPLFKIKEDALNDRFKRADMVYTGMGRPGA